MPVERVARQLTAAVGLIGVICVVAACSSSSSTEDVSVGATSTSAAAQTMTSQVACDKFYAFDLARRANATNGQLADGAQGTQALQDYLDLASRMAVSLDSAVTVGDLSPKAGVNADRIVRQITRVSKAGGDIRDVSGRVDATIGKSADRIERLCVATSHPVPQENLDVREIGS